MFFLSNFNFFNFELFSDFPKMPRSSAVPLSLDSMSERTTETRNSAPTVDYLNLAQQADTVSRGHVDIKQVAEMVKQRLDKNVLLLPISDNKELAERLTADLQTGNEIIESQYISKLLEDTDPTHLLPPEHEREKPSGQKDDWNQERNH